MTKIQHSDSQLTNKCKRSFFKETLYIFFLKFITKPRIRIQIEPKFWIRIQIHSIWIYNTDIKPYTVKKPPKLYLAFPLQMAALRASSRATLLLGPDTVMNFSMRGRVNLMPLLARVSRGSSRPMSRRIRSNLPW